VFIQLSNDLLNKYWSLACHALILTRWLPSARRANQLAHMRQLPNAANAKGKNKKPVTPSSVRCKN
jgi:hypothetical protein